MTDQGDDPVVRLRHLRATKICAKGVRAWMDTNDLDWREFVKNGYPISRLRRYDHAMVKRVIAQALKESGDGQQ